MYQIETRHPVLGWIVKQREILTKSEAEHIVRSVAVPCYLIRIQKS